MKQTFNEGRKGTNCNNRTDKHYLNRKVVDF